jgi:hypothetical protein
MTRKRRDGRRVRGSDGKWYDRRKQKDNGHRAHENRAQTALRRTRWFAGGLLGTLVGGLRGFFGGCLDLVRRGR